MKLYGDNKYITTAIVSTYNSEKYFLGCLNNLTRQTLYKNGELEIIIIDSNSNQNEYKIADQFIKHSKHIKYIRTRERETIYKAWNRGCELAKGKFITNTNTDDRHSDIALERLATALDSQPDTGVVYANCYITNHANQTFENAPITGCFLWPQYNRIELFKTCFIGPQPMWRKSLHKQYGYFDGNLKSAGDYDFWLRLASSGVHFHHIPECLGLYLMSEEGMEHSNPSLSIQESELARSRYWKQEWGNRPTPGGTYLVPIQLVRSKWKTERPDKPLVSVIIPTKDRPAMLCDAVKSVLNQTYPFVEIVVINDAGCDVQNNLSAICDLSKITYVNLFKNFERSKCRNLGIMIARGDYITYLDDDDVYYSDHIETLIGSLTFNNYDVAYTDSLMANQSVQKNKYVTIRKIPTYSHDFSYEKLLIANYIPILCLMHKKNCIEKSGYFDTNISTHEDWDLWIRLAKHYNFLHIKKVTSEYRVRDDNTNTTNSKFPQFLETYKYIYKKHPLPQFANEFTHSERKKAIFEVNIRAYKFICEILQSINFSEQDNNTDQLKNLLHTCGALQNQIISLTLYTQSKFEKNIKLKKLFLLKSVEYDHENYLAWLSLCHIYIVDKKFEDVERILRILISANPLEFTLYDLLFTILEFLNKKEQAQETILQKKHFLNLKNNNTFKN